MADVKIEGQNTTDNVRKAVNFWHLNFFLTKKEREEEGERERE